MFICVYDSTYVETQSSKILELHKFMRNVQNEQNTVNCVKDSKDSVSYESWLPGSAELVEEDTDVPCFMKLSKSYFWEMLTKL